MFSFNKPNSISRPKSRKTFFLLLVFLFWPFLIGAQQIDFTCDPGGCAVFDKAPTTANGADTSTGDFCKKQADGTVVCRPYVFLENIPLLCDDKNSDICSTTFVLRDNSLGEYANRLYQFGIAVAVALAVIFLVIGGIKYATTELVNSKSDAKETITKALWGLFFALISVIILQTINPTATNFNFDLKLKEVESINAPGEIKTKAEISQEAKLLGSGYTYTDADGKTRNFLLCKKCEVVPPSFSLGYIKPKAEAICAQVGGLKCSLTKELITKLSKMEQEIGDIYRGAPSLPFALKITEVWPPTIEHANPCHKNGTCLDLAIRLPSGESLSSIDITEYEELKRLGNKANPEQTKRKERILEKGRYIRDAGKAARLVGMCPMYEVRRSSEVAALKTILNDIGEKTQYFSIIEVDRKNFQEHFSLYNYVGESRAAYLTTGRGAGLDNDPLCCKAEWRNNGPGACNGKSPQIVGDESVPVLDKALN